MSTPTTVGVPEEMIEADRWVEGPGFFTLLGRRTRSNLPLLVGVGMLAVFVAVGISAAVVYAGHLTDLPINIAVGLERPPPGPSWAYPFGVMGTSGADIAQALYQATPIDLALIGGPILLALAIGTTVGAYAGLATGRVDGLVTTAADLVVGVPSFFLVVVLYLGIVYFIPPPYRLIVFAAMFVIVLWPYYARGVRTVARYVSRSDYVEVAKLAGAGNGRLLRQHVIPNSFAPALAQIPADIFTIFFVLTVFPFLNCFGSNGVSQVFQLISPLPNPSYYPEWGALLATGACAGWSPFPAENYWWMYTFPALVIVLFGIAVALTADGIQRLLQPRPRQS